MGVWVQFSSYEYEVRLDTVHLKARNSVRFGNIIFLQKHFYGKD
jgi:hypothetical protein